MCGIAAAVGPRAAAHQKTVGRLLDLMAHRGPDDRDLLVLDGCVLGANRLAVRSPKTCSQPRQDARSTAIVFNGELYDDLGTTACDTQRVLELNQAHGANLPHQLHGMFALALWDPARHELRCLRDRFGEKPLYWGRTFDGTVLIASEAQALARSGAMSTQLSRPALLSYLRRSWVPPTQSIWEAITPLPPGHELVVTDNNVKVFRWWSPPQSSRMNPAEAAERLTLALTGAVKRQVAASDRPVATMLSSGLDSTTVSLLAAEVGVESGFGFGFRADEATEVPQARRSAKAIGLSFHEVTDDLDPAEALRRVIDAMDEPLGDPSAIPTWYVSRAIAQDYPVVLGGDGADELLGGYLCWGRDLVEQALGDPRAAKQQPRSKSLKATLRQLQALTLERGSRARTTEPNFLDRWKGFRYYLGPEQAESLDLGRITEALPSASEIGACGTLDDVGFWDISTYLPGDILAKTDRMSMAHGLEMRSPFLDPVVSDLLLGMDWSNKVSQTQEKVVLRDAFQARWPEGLSELPKQGFGAPCDRWMSTGPIQTVFADVFASKNAAIYDHLPRLATQQLLASGGQLGWSIGVLALWLERERE